MLKLQQTNWRREITAAETMLMVPIDVELKGSELKEEKITGNDCI